MRDSVIFTSDELLERIRSVNTSLEVLKLLECLKCFKLEPDKLEELERVAFARFDWLQTQEATKFARLVSTICEPRAIVIPFPGVRK